SCTSTEPALSRLPPAVGLRARGTRDRTCTCNTPVLGRRPLLVGIPWRGPPDEDRTRLNPVDSRASSPEDNEGKKMKSRRRDSNSQTLPSEGWARSSWRRHACARQDSNPQGPH